MKVFTNYIEKHSNYSSFIKEIPESDLYNIIVIPAIGEPDLLNTLDSLWKCLKPIKSVEVIIVINASECSSSETLKLNKLNLNAVEAWANAHQTSYFKVFTIWIDNVLKKVAGAGYARKTGMDEAIRRLIYAGNPNGVISSLDADSLVSENYLIEIEKLFVQIPRCNACSIYFEHPLEGCDFPGEVYKTIIEYELHLRYFKQLLKYIGFPYYHHTVGSSFAVRASTYCKQGGMNKKHAGEDFYFLHKIMPLGNYFELNSAIVYPSPRPSDRVPFGTGATIRQFAVENKEDFLTYCFNAFKPLKGIFAEKDLFFKANTDKIDTIISTFDSVLQEFLLTNNFKASITEINRNSSHLGSFDQKFFNWFDAFRIIKYLNFVHERNFYKQPVIEAIMDYFNFIGVNQIQEKDLKSMLIKFRNLEKESKNFQ